MEALSRNQVQKLNREGHVRVDGTRRPHHYNVRGGETVVVSLPAAPALTGQPAGEDIPLNIVFEDNDIVVVNKEAGMVVHPAHGNWEGTLVNALLGRGTALSGLGGAERPGVVHRLDKDTSGVMVVAKSDAAYQALSRDMKARKMQKVYHAITWGNLGVPSRSIDAPIARHPVQRQKMAVARRGGREALTEVFVVDTFDHFDYIRIFTLTGRTHQIRVHLSSILHPILGDAVYGGRQRGVSSRKRDRDLITSLQKTMQRHALHASKLSFAHPVTGAPLEFKAAIAGDMRLALEMLHRHQRL